MADEPRPSADVVFVLPSLVGGGAERVVRTVADTLMALGVAKVEVVALTDPREMSHLKSSGVNVACLGSARVRSAMVPLLKRLRRQPPLAVLTTLKHTSMALGLLSFLLPRKTRHVARIANTYSQELDRSPRRRFLSALIRLTHRRIDGFICVSNGVRDDLVEAFGVPAEKCLVVPNPIDVEALEMMSRESIEPHSRPGAVRYLSVGRLEPQKDHETLLGAFAVVRLSRQATLTIVGDGPRRSCLEATARDLGIAEDVCFVGHAMNPYPWFRESDVFVLSSRYEGMPNVLLEALTFGLRCVSTDCPHGPREILAPGALGTLVPVGDVSALARAMHDIVTEPHDPTAGIDRVRRSHSPAQVAVAYMEALVGPGP